MGWWMALIDKAQQGGNQARERREARDFGVEAQQDADAPDGLPETEPAPMASDEPSPVDDSALAEPQEAGAMESMGGNDSAQADADRSERREKFKNAGKQMFSMMQQGGERQRGKPKKEWGAY